MEETLSIYNFYSGMNHVLYLFLIRFVISELKKLDLLKILKISKKFYHLP